MVELLVDNPLLLLFVIAAISYPLGRIKIKGSSLGVAAVLFVSLAVGALNPDIKLPEVVYMLGAVLFVYTLGLSSGPGFFASFRSKGDLVPRLSNHEGKHKTYRHAAHRAQILVLLVLAIVLLSGCVALPSAGAPTTSPAPAETAPTAAPAAHAKVVIYAPATPSSIPVILAAQHMDNVEVVIFTNHAQANAEFMRGDVDILVTGLSVGVDLFKNGAPVQVIDSYVAGLTYLVTNGKKVESFADLKGQEIYIPFEGSPIEEVTQFFAEKAGLVGKTDIKPVYAPFASSVELLKQGKATAVALPEPFVALVENQPNMVISLNYREQWDRATGSSNGYPQVTPFVMRDWAAAHPDVIARFNQEIAAALKTIEQDPAAAVAQTQAQLGLPAKVLLASLGRTDFAFVGPDGLTEEIQGYYRTIGKPLDETFDAFFYHSPQ